MANEEFEAAFFEKVGKLFKKDPNELNRDTRFSEDLHTTSLNMFALAANLEGMTGEPVSFTDVNECTTLGDALNLAEKLKAERV